MPAELEQVAGGQPVQESTSEGKSIASVLQHLIAGFTIGAAALYAIGLLITNEYLFSLGFTDFNLIRPKCIVTGTWAVLLMLACCGPALSLDRFKDGKITKKRLAEELLAGYGIAMGLGLMLCSLLVNHWSRHVAKGVLLLPLVLALGPLLYFAIWLSLYRRAHPQPSYARHSAVSAAMLLSVVVATIIIAIFIYPEVYPALGGGKPQPAKLVLTNEGLAAWRQISGSTLKGHDSVATDLDILYENESQIAVRLKNFNPDTGSVAMIDRKVVVAILPSQPLDWALLMEY